MTTVAANVNHHFLGDGKSVEVALVESVDAGDLVVAEGWLGIALADGDSGDNVNLAIDDRAYQFTVPAALSVSKGDTVFVDISSPTLNHPLDSEYGTSAGAGKVALFKALADKDANNVVEGRMLAAASLLS